MYPVHNPDDDAEVPGACCDQLRSFAAPELTRRTMRRRSATKQQVPISEAHCRVDLCSALCSRRTPATDEARGGTADVLVSTGCFVDPLYLSSCRVLLLGFSDTRCVRSANRLVCLEAHWCRNAALPRIATCKRFFGRAAASSLMMPTLPRTWLLLPAQTGGVTVARLHITSLAVLTRSAQRLARHASSRRMQSSV